MNPLRSLTFKLILAFLVVSLAGVALAALVARWANGRAFSNLVVEQAQTNFITNAANYYQLVGSWNGAARFLPFSPPKPARGPGGRHPAPGTQPPEAAPANYSFVLLDQNRDVVVPAGPYRVGTRVPAGGPTHESPVEVDGAVVGTVFPVGQAVELAPQEALYVARTNQVLLMAGLIGVISALVLGAFVARTLVRPIGELTAASRAVARGQLGKQVAIRSADELGELAASFNQMSADLAHASELRRQMTADIAHELRSPLTVISGYLEGLRDGVVQPSPERFEVMYGETQRLRRLVEDLRVLSLADAGELPLDRQRLPAAALLAQAATAFAHRAEQAGVQLEVQPEGAAGLAVDVDRQRLLQVLDNLVTNSLRHTSAGGRIKLAAEARPGAVLLVVQDDGAGIPPDVLPRIFDRFYRGDPARSQEGGESGLGLAIAKSVVEAHGGTLAAASPGPGEGSTFTISLPVADAAPGA